MFAQGCPRDGRERGVSRSTKVQKVDSIGLTPAEGDGRCAQKGAHGRSTAMGLSIGRPLVVFVAGPESSILPGRTLPWMADEA